MFGNHLGEPERCVHIGDRESDIYELFCTAEQENTRFLIRTCVDRAAGKSTTILKKMKRQSVQGSHEIEIPDASGNLQTVKLSIRFCKMTIHAPVAKQKKYPPLSLTLVFAQEVNPPKSREAIHWKLITNLEVGTLESAIEKLDWYAQRWKIETFFTILKSGCRAEKSRLHSAERLTNLLALLCIIAWRVFWLTMINRHAPENPAEEVFTKTELAILDRLSKGDPPKEKSSSYYLREIAKIGGYLARGKDPPPGNIIMWRGISRFTDIYLGFELSRNCG
ncbi:MAG: IS4 family transposase [Planctomycetota bacterium]